MKVKKPDEYKKCAKCKNEIRPVWEQVMELNGFIGNAKCEYCGHFNMYISGSDKFQRKVQKIIENDPNFNFRQKLKH